MLLYNDKPTMSLHYSIDEMISLDNRPFSIVKNEEFKRLVREISLQYK